MNGDRLDEGPIYRSTICANSLNMQISQQEWLCSNNFLSPLTFSEQGNHLYPLLIKILRKSLSIKLCSLQKKSAVGIFFSGLLILYQNIKDLQSS